MTESQAKKKLYQIGNYKTKLEKVAELEIKGTGSAGAIRKVGQTN